MNPYVADPHWRGYITWYFFLGGLAAGSYAMARLAEVLGNDSDRRVARLADWLAFPLVNVCGILLVIDLNRPERFWHMLIASETWMPIFKWWSPMSVGSWGLALFAAFSFVSFLAVLSEQLGRGGWTRWLRQGVTGLLFALGATGAAFFLASYTGVLLAATNTPVWADTTWLGALFLASSASTGLAALVLLANLSWSRVGRDAMLLAKSIERFERLDTYAIGLELVILLIWCGALGALALPTFTAWPGVLVVGLVVPIGLILPWVLRWRMGHRAVVPAALLVLLGGFVLRAAIVGMPLPLMLAAH